MPADLTELLKNWAAGDREALNELTPVVYADLKRIARRQMRNERDGNTLQTTALVNEAYLRLAGAENIPWQNRVHFFAVAAQLMRRILVDAARARGRAKRGGSAIRLCLEDLDVASDARSNRIVALDDALTALAAFDPRKAQVVELRFFGGLEVNEAAAFLKVSPQTVLRDWKLAKSWLLRELDARAS